MSVEMETEDLLDHIYIRKTRDVFQYFVDDMNGPRFTLKPGPANDRFLPVDEIFIEGWHNVRKNGQDLDVAHTLIPGILNWNGLWIRWESGNISVGPEGDDRPFLTFSKEQVPVTQSGVAKVRGTPGSWIVDENDDRAEPYEQERGGYSGLCWVMARNGEVPPEGVVGGEHSGEPLFVVRAKVNDKWVPGKLPVNTKSIPEKLPVQTKWACVPAGEKEKWVTEYEVLCCFPERASAGNTDQSFNQEGGDLRWVTSENGAVPPNVVIGGEDEGQSVYVIRAKMKGSWTPGKLSPSHGTAYVPWDGEVHAVPKYEVLSHFDEICQTCNGEKVPSNAERVNIQEVSLNPLEWTAQPYSQDYFGLWWVKARNGETPPNAVIGGEDQGESLYVIRAKTDDGVTPGKLLVSHSLSYVPWGGREYEISDYQVLCYFPGNCHSCYMENTPPNAKQACFTEAHYHKVYNTVQSHTYRREDHNYSGLCWRQGDKGGVPGNAVVGGEENGEPLYLIRAKFKENLTPGKLMPSDGMSQVSWGGREHGIFKYQTLCYFPKDCKTCNKEKEPLNAEKAQVNYTLQPNKEKVGRRFGLCWVEARNGEVPPRAVVGGEDMCEPIYLTRARFKGKLIPGRLSRYDSACYVPWGGKEYGLFKYEVLCYYPGNCGVCYSSNIMMTQLACIDNTGYRPFGARPYTYWQGGPSYFGLYWVPAKDGIPPNAVVTNEDLEEPVYIIRAKLEESFRPGGLLLKNGLSYISWSGREHQISEYEVLCYFPGDCEVCKKGEVPFNTKQALTAPGDGGLADKLSWRNMVSLFKNCLKPNQTELVVSNERIEKKMTCYLRKHKRVISVSVFYSTSVACNS